MRHESLCMPRPILQSHVIYMNGHNQFYLAIHNHAKNTRISPTLLHNVFYHGLYQ